MAILKGGQNKLPYKRRLRREMTGPERRLWSKLRSRQLEKLRFRRQHGIGPYIVDFYCPEKAVAIEVDGETHGDDKQITRDERRDSFLKALGISVFRYTNDEIMKKLDQVIEDLRERICKDRPSPFVRGR